MLSHQVKQFNPTRLTLARFYAGYSKQSLSTQTSLSSRMVAAHESGKKPPSFKELKAYSDSTGFSVDFFFGKTVELVEQVDVNFRALMSVRQAKRSRAIAEGSIAAGILLPWMEENFKLPTLDLPDADILEYFSPEDAALFMRDYWKLDHVQIHNMLHLLESRGIRVFALSKALTDLDALSFWYKGKTPIVLLDASKPAERTRFTLAHELGHLLLHRNNSKDTRDMEKEANAFAASFLMPAKTFSSHAPRMCNDKALIAYKRYWGVSYKALVYRMRTLNLITDWQAKMAYIDLQKNYGNQTEPKPIDHESSQLFTKMKTALKSHFPRLEDIADQLNIPSALFESLTFGMSTRSCLRLVWDSESGGEL